MNTVEEKIGYAFWYLMVACSVFALINSFVPLYELKNGPWTTKEVSNPRGVSHLH